METAASPNPPPGALNTMVCITAWRRPDNFRRVLSALAACHGAQQLRYLVSIDSDHPLRQQAMLRALKASGLPARAVAHRRRLGCAGNVGFAFRTAFAEPDVEAVIMLEDDTVPSRDYLAYSLAMLKRFQHDERVFSISGYHRRVHQRRNITSAHQTTEGAGDPRKIFIRRWFTSWGWATWRRVHDEIRHNWFGIRWNHKEGKTGADTPEGEAFLDYVVRDNLGSYSWPLNRYWRRGRCEIAPDLSRIQNIGAEEGMFCVDPQWHRDNQHVEIWMGDAAGPPVDELVLADPPAAPGS